MPDPEIGSQARLRDCVRDLETAAVSAQYREPTEPTHFVCIDDFLKPDFAKEVAAAYPSFQAAVDEGAKRFDRVNEQVKTQLTDASEFPPAVHQLHELLASDELLALLSRITGIDALLADPDLKGGGMHLMGPCGYLGVHVDFNYLKKKQLYRRLNLILYLTPEWRPDWGGEFEFWDPDVKRCVKVFEPAFNRCIVFNTTEVSFHGVREIRCPSTSTRNAFATYYYTAEPAADWKGFHSTRYRPRPDELSKRFIQMPLASTARWFRKAARRARGIKSRALG